MPTIESPRRTPVLPVSVCLGFGLLFVLAPALLVWFADRPVMPTALFAAGAYLVICGGYCGLWMLHEKRLENNTQALEVSGNDILKIFRDSSDIPYALITTSGVIKIVNKSLQNILGFPNPICNVPLGDISTLSVRELESVARVGTPDAHGTFPTKNLPLLALDNRTFRLSPYKVTIQRRAYYLTVFTDVTEFVRLSDKCQREDVAVAHVVLDNLDELTQYVRTSNRAAMGEVENVLKEYAASMDALLREYDRDKFMMMFSREQLDKSIAHGFDILEKIRSIKLGDNSFPVTVSIGISMVPGTMAQREEAAESALDIAMSRGGDQVVLRRPDGLTYYGGRVKPIPSNSSIMSRVNSQELCTLAAQADNVLIMGHHNPDFDCIGACIGLAFLCRHAAPDIDVNIITNRNDVNFRALSPILDGIPDADALFVDSETGMDLIRSGTLVVIADVNSMRVVEAPDVIPGVSQIAIVDHHRQVEAFGFTPVMNYIHPTASSACELVTEMVEQSPWNEALSREEANALLAGIMLDTKNFTQNTGTQTFAAVHFLYDRRAHTSVVRTCFRENIAERVLVSDLGAHAQIYRGCIAISRLVVDKDAGTAERIAASKAADSLLNINGVEASFCLMQCRNKCVLLSARSADRINVQLIAEKLGGGGHYGMAGAQLQDTSLDAAVAKLLDAIDEYMEQNHIS